MQLLVDKGDFEILAHPEDAESIIKKAGCTCYQSEQRTTKSSADFVEMLRKRGHWSMFDHVSATVWFKNISRGFTHEMVRHRLAAFAQESTRYVDPTEDPLTGKPGKVDLKVVMPPHKNLEKILDVDMVGESLYYHEDMESYNLENSYLRITPAQMPQLIENMYKALRDEGWKQEDARQILPIGTKSDIVVTADFTEWRHIFRLRTQKAAHWEIRTVMCKVLEAFKELFPTTFNDFIKAGEDDNGVPYYKIKGFVENIEKMIGNAFKEWRETQNTDSASSFACFLKKYYNQNY